MATTKRAASPPSDPPALAPPRTPTSFPTVAAARPSTVVQSPELLHPEQSRPTPAAASSKPSAQSTKPKTTQAHGRSPIALTGAAALAETKRRERQQLTATEAEKRTSPNPAVQAMQALMGSGGISRPSDSPAPNKLSEPLRKAAEKITIPRVTQGASLETSPASRFWQLHW